MQQWPATWWVHYTTSCNTQSSAPEDGQNNCPKHVEIIGIINKPLLLHLVGCLYYLYQWCTVKQISKINRLVLIVEALCVLCEVRTVSVCVMWVNLSFYGVHAVAQVGSMVGRERWTGLPARSSTLQSVSLDAYSRHIFILTLLLSEGQAGEA